MPVAKQFKSLTGGELQPANVATLEEELSALWRAAADDHGTEHPVMRASVLTLIAFVESEEEGRETVELISHIIAQNPCRAILLVAEPRESPEGLTAWISAQCHLPASGARQVCCEQIYVRARGGAVNGLDNVVLPLIVPELPVYLWWRAGRFTPPSFLDQVLRRTNRVLVDSGRFEEPEIDLATLARQVERSRATDGIAFSDLNWARLTPCRELIAQNFDSGEAGSCLQDLSNISFEWETTPDERGSHIAHALLLTAWLASRLDWQPVTRLAPGAGPNRVVEFRCGDRSVHVEWVVRHKASQPSTPFKVTLKTRSDPPAIFSVIESTEEGIAHTRAEIPGRAPLEKTTRLTARGEVELVNDELKFPARDKIYEEMLNLIAQAVEL
ncbi:MAG TPA: glucose-6-phosphate dehydrogenase assembly protein OpcA [Terriglobia bacterium]|nr:glucose-6-phosphate dehydrogenase assembly protein OpcA [Terriglobia bacterium]